MTVTLDGLTGLSTPGISNSEGYTGDGLTIAANAPAGAATIDSSGNLGLGVTPSAWGASYRAEDVGGACAITSSTTGDVWYNCYNNGTNNLYKNSGYKASIFRQNNGAFEWHNTNTTGPSAGATASLTQAMTLDASGNLGIGTSSPNAKLDIVATTNTIRLGRSTSSYATIDSNSNAGSLNLNADAGNTASGGSMTFSFAGTERARITSGGEVYIAGTTDQGAYNLQVNGTGVWGAGAYVNGSDERLKDNIQTLNDGLAVVTQLRPVTFKYKPEHSKDQSVQPGFIAQELQQAMAGKDYVDGVVITGPEYLNVAYQNLIPILTAAIQEQQDLITALTARIEALEAK